MKRTPRNTSAGTLLFSGINFLALTNANLDLFINEEDRFLNTLDALTSLGIISEDYANLIEASVKDSKKKDFKAVEVIENGVIMRGPVTNEMADEVIAGMKSKGYKGKLVINSPGGSAIAGFRIANMVKKHSENIDVVVDGVAHSAASYPVFNAKNVEMDEGSQVMIHRPVSCGIGNFSDFVSKSEALQKIEGSMLAVYTRNTNVGADKMNEYMSKETYFSSKELGELGLTVSETKETYTNQAPDADVEEAVNGLGYGPANSKRTARQMLELAEDDLASTVENL